MNKIMEYMFFGLPIVGFDLDESRVSAAGSAVFAESNDEREMAKLVAELLDDPTRRAEMSRIGMERIERELSWETERPRCCPRTMPSSRRTERRAAVHAHPDAGLAPPYSGAAPQVDAASRGRASRPGLRGGDGLLGTASRAGELARKGDRQGARHRSCPPDAGPPPLRRLRGDDRARLGRPPAYLPLLAVTRRRRTPTVLHFHGSQPDRVRAGGHGPFGWLSLRLVRMADAVMVLSSEERSQWEALHPSGGFYVVTNPYEHPRGRRASPATPHVPVLLFVGRLMPAKGVFDLLEAVALLNRTEPWRLLMIGDGSAEGELRSRIEVLGLGDRVTLAGYLTGERLQDAYELADVFVLPTTWAEGFPTVITEAMAAGLPVVTTRLRGAADHLVEGVHALFVPPRDPGALAARLGRLLGIPRCGPRWDGPTARR